MWMLLPLVYCSISGKGEDIYGEVFGVVLQHLSQRLKSITIDFEKAVENVVKQQLPMTTINFCFFFISKRLYGDKYKLVAIDFIILIIVLNNPIDILS